MLVLPVLRHVSIDPILTTTREYAGDPSDEVILSTLHDIPVNDSGTMDPFVESSEAMYDIRFKRLVSDQVNLDRHNSEDYVCSSQAHFCLESDDYSPLSEINTGLKDLERKVRDEMEAYDRERIAKIRAEQRATNNRTASTTIPSSNATDSSGGTASNTWIDQISSWFVPANTASTASSSTGRWSSFSVAPVSFSPAEEDDGYDVNRRSASFSFLPLEAQAHIAMSDSKASSWWGSAPASSSTTTKPAPKVGKQVSFDVRSDLNEDTQSSVSSVASSPEYLPGPLEEFEIYQKSLSNQHSAPSPQAFSPPPINNIAPAVEISRESAAERAAKNKDKIAARLAALREKQLSGK
ncbi:hypothetical protein EON65_19210 [archaeon]|nr:MAG: hypothetical protein EON65_19210 [archaeon]